MTERLKKEMEASLLEARKKEYSALAEELKPKTPVVKNAFCAFLVGGGICLFGQVIYLLLGFTDMTDRHAVTLTLIILIFLAALFTSLGLYDKLGAFAGAGSVVPITGFSNSVVAPALEWKTEGFIGGLGAKLFTLAGPVIVYGIAVSVLLGFVKYLWLFFTGGLS